MRGLLRYDHYKVLGIERQATAAEIKRAFRTKVMASHPDRNASPRAAEFFQAVQEAYDVLSDPRQRAEYDTRLQHYRPWTERDRIWSVRERTGFPARDPRPASRTERFAFLGLHVTGLLFGLALVMGILLQITFRDWSYLTLVFCLPGLAVIPDSYQGLRLTNKARH